MDVAAIVLALALLMAIAYRGLPVIVFAPACALLAVALSGGPLLPSYTESFMAGAARYIRDFFPIFLLGAWTSVVNVAGIAFGVGWHSLVVALAGGGGMFLLGLIGWLRRR